MRDTPDRARRIARRPPVGEVKHRRKASLKYLIFKVAFIGHIAECRVRPRHFPTLVAPAQPRRHDDRLGCPMNGPESPAPRSRRERYAGPPWRRPRRGPLVLAYMASAPDGLDAHDDSFRSRSTRRAGRRSSRRLPRRAGSPPSGGSCATSVPERLSVPVANHAHARPRPLPFLPARHLRTFYCLEGDSRPGRGTPPHSRRETLGLVGPSVPGITGAAVRVARPAGCCEGSPRRLASMISASMTPGRTIAPPHAHGDMGMLPIRTSSARSRIGGETGRGSAAGRG